MEYFISSFQYYTIYELLWFFVIYSVGGWCLEVAYHVVTMGKFVNRGFLNGPVCPIYGFGMIVVIICLYPIRSNHLLMFAGAVLLTTLLELVTGFVLEKVFHERWWDYSAEPFNFRGYICLKFSIMWGLGCVFVIDIIHTFFYGLIRIIPHTPGLAVLALCLIVFAADAVATITTIMRLNKRLSAMNEVASRIRQLSDTMGEHIYDITVQGMEKSEDVKIDLDIRKQRAEEFRNEAVLGLAEKYDEFTDSLDDKLESFEDDVSSRMDELEYTVSTRMENLEDGLENVQEDIEALIKRFSELKNTRRFGQRRLIRAFPDMKNPSYTKELESLKQLAAQKKASRKNNRTHN